MTGSADKADKPSGGTRTPRGRPTKVKADTAEGVALVEFLQHLTAGVKVRELAERCGPYSKTKWAEYLNGTNLIPPHALEKLVRTLITEPQRQKAELEQGQALQAKAARAEAGRLTARERTLPDEDLKRLLAKAEQGESRAQKALLRVTLIVLNLMTLNERLRQRCETLENTQKTSEERRALLQRLHVTKEQLAEAERRREEFERLWKEAVKQAERYRLALETPPSPSADTQDATTVATQAQEPTLDAIDAMLESTAAHLGEVSHEADELRREHDLELPEDKEPTSSGRPKIVRGQLADKDDDPAGDEMKAGAEPASDKTSPKREPAVGPLSSQSLNDPLKGPFASLPRVAPEYDPLIAYGPLAPRTPPPPESAPPSPSREVRKSQTLPKKRRSFRLTGPRSAGLVAVACALFLGVDVNIHGDGERLTPSSVVSGIVPLETSVGFPGPFPALGYSLSPDQQLRSTFQLPIPEKHWIMDDPGVNLKATLDFVPTAGSDCLYDFKIPVRMADVEAEVTPTQKVNLEVAGINGSTTLTARMYAPPRVYVGPTSCSGTLRLINPTVYNKHFLDFLGKD